MTSSFVKAQFMSPPGADPAVPIGAVKAGPGIAISADGTISTDATGGTVRNIFVSNGVSGGGPGPDVFLSLIPPTSTALGGVRTLPGSGVSIDSSGIIRAEITNISITGGVGINVASLGGGAYNVSLKPAQSGSAVNLGGVYVPLTAPGLEIQPDGQLVMLPAGNTRIGGIKAGSGCSVTPDGTLNCTGSGGTITGVGVGTGLGGGGTSGAVTLFLQPAQSNVIGGIYPGDNCNVDPDGRLNIDSAALGVATVTGNDPIYTLGTQTNPSISIQNASTTQRGAVVLSSSTSSSDANTAANSLAVKTVADVANAALPLAGGTMTGAISFAAGQTFPTATTSSLGVVQPDGVTVLVDGNGIISAVGGGGGGVTSIAVNAPLTDSGTLTNPSLGINSASLGSLGVVEPDGTTISIDTNGVISAVAPNLQSVTSAGATTTDAVTVGSLTAAGLNYPTTDGANGTVLTTDGAGNITFQPMVASGALLTTGGTMTGDITFAGTQSFPGVLPLSGGTMTGTISFAAGQTISGYVANSLYASTGALTYASGANTPATLNVGSNGNILGVNAGLPAWRTAAQLGLLTTAAASTTYATIDSPSFTGPATVNAGAGAGGNALTISGGNLVLATQFTPTSSSSTGSVGELAWDNAGYLYFCYAANTWGRVQIDLTPF